MYINKMFRVFFDTDKGDGSGGAGSESKGQQSQNSKNETPDISALIKEIQELKSQISGNKQDSDQDLLNKARNSSKSSEDETKRTKMLESALLFSVKAPEFLKLNQALLPKEAEEIFKQSEKEKYNDAIEKDSALKSGLVQSFFQLQENVDLLTPGQKAILDDYLKLTKTGKQEKAQEIYDMVFEPTLETRRRIKKAEALAKGYGGGSSSDESHKNKMLALSRQHYLGEKK